MPLTTEIIRLDGFSKASRCKAAIRLVRTPTGDYLASYEHWAPKGGSLHGWPHEDSHRYPTRDDAITAMCHELIARFKDLGESRAARVVETYLRSNMSNLP